MMPNPQTAIVEALLEAFFDGWNRHDPKALAGTVAPDGELYNFRGKRLDGRDAVGRFFTHAFAQNLKESRIAPTAPRIRFVGDSAAAVDVVADLTGVRDPKGAPRPDRRCLLDATAGRNPQGGWWLVVVHLRDLPQENEAAPGAVSSPASATPDPGPSA